MAYRIEVADAARRDRDDIYSFLVQSYVNFGDDTASARQRAKARIGGMQSAMESLAKLPLQGTLHREYSPNARSVTKNRFIFWFKTDETEQVITILAIFFGSQDHQRLMLRRMLARD